MPRRLHDPDADRTPGARLSESGPHGLVGYQIAQAAIVTHQVFTAEAGTPFALRPVEYTVLALIASNPDVTARQLAHGLNVTPPNIAVWLDKLDARGLVQRTRSDTDARKQHLRVTPAGATLVRDATRRLQAGEAAALSAALTAAEHAMLIELLHKVALARRRTAGG
jgi:DNA-binding MarR family transcriptional regulator